MSHLHEPLPVWQKDQLLMYIKVQTNARRTALVEFDQGLLKVHLAVMPIDGKANKALCKLLATEFAVSLSHVDIVNGLTSKMKRVCITAPKVIPDCLTLVIPLLNE